MEAAASSATMVMQLEEARRQMDLRVQALNDSNAKNIQIGARVGRWHPSVTLTMCPKPTVWHGSAYEVCCPSA